MNTLTITNNSLTITDLSQAKVLLVMATPSA
jgi:hypothetical protein